MVDSVPRLSKQARIVLYAGSVLQNSGTAIKSQHQPDHGHLGCLMCFEPSVFGPVERKAMTCMGTLINGAEAYAILKFYAKAALDPDTGSSVNPIFDDNALLCPKAIVEPMVDSCFIR